MIFERGTSFGYNNLVVDMLGCVMISVSQHVKCIGDMTKSSCAFWCFCKSDHTVAVLAQLGFMIYAVYMVDSVKSTSSTERGKELWAKCIQQAAELQSWRCLCLSRGLHLWLAFSRCSSVLRRIETMLLALEHCQFGYYGYHLDSVACLVRSKGVLQSEVVAITNSHSET